MFKSSGHIFLSPTDTGVEKCTIDEIIELMKPTEECPPASLYEFGLIVNELFNDPNKSP